jgi:hypothetical protein
MTQQNYIFAAFAYVGSALLTILLTLFLGGTPERFKAEAPYLLIGLPIIFLFGFIINNGHKWFFAKWFTRILTIFAGFRSSFFFLNGFGIQLHFDFKNFQWGLNRPYNSLHHLFLINGLAVGIAVYFMARAGWSK